MGFPEILLYALIPCFLVSVGVFCAWYFSKRSIRSPMVSGPKGVDIVTDLDRLITEPVGFRFGGKVHLIKPMKMETYLGVLNQCAQMSEIHKAGIKDHREILKAYARLFAVVCDTISMRDVERMSQAQIMALFNEIMRSVSGKAQADLAEKKTQMEKLNQPTSPSVGVN